MIIEIPNECKDKRFSVQWVSSDGKMQVRHHYTLQGARKRYDHMRGLCHAVGLLFTLYPEIKE